MVGKHEDNFSHNEARICECEQEKHRRSCATVRSDDTLARLSEYILRLFYNLKTPFESTVISHMGVNGLVPLQEISESDSRVKRDLTCLLLSVSFQNSIFSECR